MNHMTEQINSRNINVHEAFQIALKVERNGIEFYRKASGLYDNVRVSDIFRKLYHWELAHIGTIDKIHGRILQHAWETDTYRPERMEVPEALLMVGLAIFGVRPDPAEELSGFENCIEVLDIAIQKEKDTVIFYTGLKEFLHDPAEHDNIDEVIREKLYHIGYLENAIRQLSIEKANFRFDDFDEPVDKCPRCGASVCSGNAYNLPMKPTAQACTL